VVRVLSDREAIEILRGVALTAGEREASRAVRLMVEIWEKAREAVPAAGDDDPAGGYGVPNPRRVRLASPGLSMIGATCSRCGSTGHLARACRAAAE
jgi:hypothetical protein